MPYSGAEHPNWSINSWAMFMFTRVAASIQRFRYRYIAKSFFLLVAILVQQGHDNSSHARQLRPVAGQFRGGWEEKWWVTVGNGNIVVIMSPAMVMAMQRSCCYGKGYQRCEDGEWYGCFGCRPLWTFVCPYPSKRFQDVPRKAVNEGIDFIGQGWAAGTASNKAKNCWVSWRHSDVIGAGSSVQRLVHQTTSRFSRWTWHIWLQNIFEHNHMRL